MRRRTIIQRPGRGSSCAMAGSAATRNRGTEADAEGEEDGEDLERPARQRKRHGGADEGRRAGASPGEVANTPVAELAGERGVTANARQPPTKAGTGISNQPQRLAANSVNRSIIAMRNQGCWN